MSAFRSQRGQVLIIVFGAIFLGGGLAAGVLSSGTTLKAMKKDIKALELEKGRRDRALDILSQWEKAVKPVWKVHSRSNDELVKLMRTQYTTRDALDNQFAAQGDSMSAAEEQVLVFRDELRSVLSKSEWDKVFAKD